MKLGVLVPSQEYLSQAGARIRYKRIQPHLAACGIDLALEEIGRFDPLKADYDVVLLSKCHDPRSLIVAALLSSRGTTVGIDLFDDYFSAESDSRLMRYRNWLSNIVQGVDFALGSTEAMTRVATRYRADLPTHVMNDPAPDYKADQLAALVKKKLEDLRHGQVLKVLWFGTGDNAFFPVGLADLSAFGSVLGELARGSMDVQLVVLTNGRALTAEGLALIKALPVPAVIREWSEDAENYALQEAFLAFLPVNAQGFSAAKSLNRAVTALSSGCQILSVGYPLYEPLDEFIYRDARAFTADLAAGRLRLSSTSLARYNDRMNTLASAAGEAQRLTEFLFALTPAARPPSVPLVVIHGHATLADGHKLVQQAGGYSVASPFCSVDLNFDVIFRTSPVGLEMLVSQTARSRLAVDKAARLQPAERIHAKKYSLMTAAAVASATISPSTSSKQPLPLEFATYKKTMHQIQQMMDEAFGPVRSIVSETSRLPFSIDG